jgi:hypothetical protein
VMIVTTRLQKPQPEDVGPLDLNDAMLNGNTEAAQSNLASAAMLDLGPVAASKGGCSCANMLSNIAKGTLLRRRNQTLRRCYRGDKRRGSEPFPQRGGALDTIEP